MLQTYEKNTCDFGESIEMLRKISNNIRLSSINPHKIR